MTGRIVKAIAGFYYVEVESGIYECRAKGIFRKEGIKPCVGDIAQIEITHEADMEANVIDIAPRKNLLFRPNAANVDQAMLVFALESPKPNEGVLDRFLIQMERQDVKTIICFNKADLVSDEEAKRWMDIYENAGYECILCCVKTGEGIDKIKKCLCGKLTVLAGPSGVGKSSLTNILAPGAFMETGVISKKLKRGKNTTRHVELITIEDGTYICDTPGFTSFVPEDISSEDLRFYYPEILAHEGKCRFNGCVHIGEPDCSVKKAVKEGKLPKERYETYMQLFTELKDAEKNKY